MCDALMASIKIMYQRNETWSNYRSAHKNVRQFSTHPISYIFFLMSLRTSSLFHWRLLFRPYPIDRLTRSTTIWAKLLKPQVNSFEIVCLAAAKILSRFFMFVVNLNKKAQNKTLQFLRCTIFSLYIIYICYIVKL